MSHEQSSPRVGDQLGSGPEQSRTSTYNRFKRLGSRIGKLALLGGLSLGTGLALATVMPAASECGPHKCDVRLSPGSEHLTIDGGPLGPVRLPLEDRYAVPVGATIRLHEIPSDSNGIEATDVLFGEHGEMTHGQLPSQEIERIAQLYSTAPDDAHEIAGDMLRHIAKLSTGAGAGYSAMYLTLGRRRRQEIIDQTRSAAKPLLVATAVGATLLQPTLTLPDQGETWVATGEIFTDTPLEGLEVRGAFWQYSLGGIRQVLRYQQRITAYYDTAARNVTTALEQARLAEQLAEDSHVAIAIRTTDLHCNYGMNAVLTAIAEAVDADLWIDTGDMVMSGSSAESICIERISSNMPRARIVAPGNHESDETTAQFWQSGFVVTDGTVQTVAGLPFIGIPDPNRSPFGGRQPYDREVSRQAGRPLLGPACNALERPILLAHSLDLALEPMRSGCTQIGFGGHKHRQTETRVGQQAGGEGQFFTGGTSGGAEQRELTIGELQAPAFVYVDVYDRDAQGQLDISQIFAVVVHPDQTAQLQTVFNRY